MEGKQQQQERQGNKGLLELCIFGAALATGTASSILCKVMYEATDDRGRHFDKPIAQTFCMFLAMLVGMPVHWLVVAYKIPFPGYHHVSVQDDKHAATTSTAAATVVIDVDATPRINSRKNAGGGEHESLLPTSYAHKSNNDTCNDDENDDIVDFDSSRSTHQAGQMVMISWKTYLQLCIPAF